MKYLIITEAKDFISTSLNAKKHLEKSKGCAVMVYDKEGWFIRYAKRINGAPVKVRACCDGEPRKWAADFIRNHNVGDMVDDASIINNKNQLNENI